MEMKWETIGHLNKEYHLCFVKEEEWGDYLSVGAVSVSGSDPSIFIWAVKGGFPNGFAGSLEEARAALCLCLQTEFFDKGLVPWQTNFISLN